MATGIEPRALEARVGPAVGIDAPADDPMPVGVGAAGVTLVDLTSARRRRHRRELPREVRRLLGPLLMLAVWCVVSWGHLVSERTFPPPQAVFDAGADLVRSGQLWGDLWASLKRAMTGLAIGTSAGVVIATVAGLSRRAEDVVDSIMQVMKAIPNFALVPLFIIWLGIDEAPKITLVALSTGVPIYINTYSGIRNVDAKLVDLSATLGLSRLGLTRHIVLPGALPGFLVGLRIALTNAWLALIFAETINAEQGLGSLMSDARSYFRLDIMVFVICIYAALGLTSYSFVRFLERRLLTWRPAFTGH